MAAHDFIDRSQISILNVPTIFPQVHRNTIRTSLLCHHNRIGRPWVTGTPGLPQSGNMIDIDTE
jgi:hypothetical protein